MQTFNTFFNILEGRWDLLMSISSGEAGCHEAIGAGR